MKSENPVKYGETYESNNGNGKTKIIISYQDYVARSMYYDFERFGDGCHYDEFLKCHTLVPSKWKPLTENNWEQYRGKAVWITKNNISAKLLARTNNDNPYVIEYENGTVGRVFNLSAYNNYSERPSANC